MDRLLGRAEDGLSIVIRLVGEQVLPVYQAGETAMVEMQQLGPAPTNDDRDVDAVIEWTFGVTAFMAAITTSMSFIHDRGEKVAAALEAVTSNLEPVASQGVNKALHAMGYLAEAVTAAAAMIATERLHPGIATTVTDNCSSALALVQEVRGMLQ